MTTLARYIQAKSAVEGFKGFRVTAENESEKMIREIMMDNARELSMGKMRAFDQAAPQSRTTLRLMVSRMNNWGTHQCRARYAPPFGPGESLWAEAFSTVTYIRNRFAIGCRRRLWMDVLVTRCCTM